MLKLWRNNRLFYTITEIRKNTITLYDNIIKKESNHEHLIFNYTKIVNYASTIKTSDSEKEINEFKNIKLTGKMLEKFKIDKIRNFSIIAHVDHGKSTLADRIMEMTGAINPGSKSQYLDKLQVERERGITVKAQTVSLIYKYKNENYLLNLIDTPGHVDFCYEVSRSLAACQGVLLLVDATQGIQAQTVANFYLAFELELDIIPIINKIDMATADPDKIKKELKDNFDINSELCLLVSAKKGIGIDNVLKAVVEKIKPPIGNNKKPLRALLFDAYHDEYRGVICNIEIIDGIMRKGDKIMSIASKESYEVLEIGVLAPEPQSTGVLMTGQVGYVITGMKSTRSAQIGDTWYLEKEEVEALPGFKPVKSNVFAGIYPVQSEDYESLNKAIDKLTLNDASVFVRKENSVALGSGFRCGFLGMLHMDVFKQRLEQEYGTSILITTPTVPYRLGLEDGTVLSLENPCDYPMKTKIEFVEEPTVIATIIVPQEFVGVIIELTMARRGELLEHVHLSSDRVMLKYKLGFSELANEYFDELKSVSKGYASLDYEESDYRRADLQRLDLLINGKIVDAFARVIHKDQIQKVGRALCLKLKKVLDRELFEIVIQASAQNKIIARESLPALRKNVLAKCYGGDITRKKKLLEKQKEGKKRMRAIGSVNVSQEAFQELLKLK